MKKKDEAYELSKEQTTLSAFLEAYNQSIPDVFPHVSVATLEKFKSLHPVLFKDGDLWSIAQHRKKLIDWLFSNRPSL
ncbi:MAG: hypothetical protein HY764_01780 [Candidatus Portnoybacteria bacterium]|nr:hypothetical protein [Candidatus Portnoybacteria bacterium]